MLIYADICTLCRPFDDQSQPRVWLETHALCVILNLVEIGRFKMVRSPIHDLENARNPKEFRRLWVERCLTLATHAVSLNLAIKQRALALESLGVGALDSLHAACAEAAGCDHLLTCDDRFRKRYQGPITVLNPADFVVASFQQTP
jgi:predicted nucleic acid-binding protein|uniref:PIN domain-containing protein n=1 Tax=Prosthecobacter sp. TaxID=1965333 RepID=UPI0037843E67